MHSVELAVRLCIFSFQKQKQNPASTDYAIMTNLHFLGIYNINIFMTSQLSDKSVNFYINILYRIKRMPNHVVQANYINTRSNRNKLLGYRNILS